MADIEQAPTSILARYQDRIDIHEKQKADTSNEVVQESHNIQDELLIFQFGPDDPEDPKNWSKRAKWAATLSLSAQGFNRIMISTVRTIYKCGSPIEICANKCEQIMAPAIPIIAIDLSMSAVESTMALSVYVLATAFGPLVIGPLSEIYGRKNIIHISNIWFLAWNLICGFANSKGLLISARLLAGFGASAVYTVAYGVLADFWPAEQRGNSLSIYLLIPLTGAAIGPIIGGFIVQYSTWRWMFWSNTIFQAAAELLTTPVMQETYAPLLLRRRAAKLRPSLNDSRYFAASARTAEGISTTTTLWTALSRPLRLLICHLIIQVQAFLCGLNYGLL
jgi:multidrug resistance protein